MSERSFTTAGSSSTRNSTNRGGKPWEPPQQSAEDIQQQQELLAMLHRASLFLVSAYVKIGDMKENQRGQFCTLSLGVKDGQGWKTVYYTMNQRDIEQYLTILEENLPIGKDGIHRAGWCVVAIDDVSVVGSFPKAARVTFFLPMNTTLRLLAEGATEPDLGVPSFEETEELDPLGDLDIHPF